MRKIISFFWGLFRNSIIGKLIRSFLPQGVVNQVWHLPIAILANFIYGFPSRKFTPIKSGLTVIGVTGTDGKTTTVNMIYQIFKAAGKKVSMVSTINAAIGGKKLDTGFHVTSPHSFTIQQFLKEADKSGSEYIVLEVTSHALDQHRFWGINFDIGVITNITHEHLDYHKSWDNYFRAKARLIKHVRVAVLNKDEQHFKRLSYLTHKECQVVSFGSSQQADFNPFKFPIKLQIPGQFNMLNAQASSAVAVCLEVDSKIIRKALASFQSLPGRMEEVPNKKNIKVVIDFAHTPNGLEQALTTLRERRNGHLVAVIGAEGYRDQQKRPLMGTIAAKLADRVVVTAVDPRGKITEINQQIVAGAEKAGARLGQTLFVEDDRQQAINLAINKLAHAGDTVGIFGKGHESSMNLDGKHEIPWSDKEAVMKALKSIKG